MEVIEEIEKVLNNSKLGTDTKKYFEELSKMKEKQYIRFTELSGIGITRKEYEGVKLFMEIEELIQETEKAFCSLKEIISDYSAREEEAKTETKIIMLVNKWTSPYIACTELVKRIETNETFIKNICKASGTTLTKIGYKTKAKEAMKLIQAQVNK
jgi:hypothetical protein